MQKCSSRWQSAGLAVEVSQGRYECEAACVKYASNGAGVVTTKRALPAKPGPFTPELGLGAGAGFASFEACMNKCSGKWQSAGLGSEVSQGREECQAACAEYAGSGAGLIAKKAAPVKAGPFTPELGLGAGAGFVSFEACMDKCSGKWQSAGIGSEVSQGREECQAACAEYFGNGAGVITKKEASAETGPFTPDIGLGAGAGSITYEGCMQKCSGKWQHAGLVLGASQGRMECEASCARFAAAGSGVIVKKAAAPRSLDNDASALSSRRRLRLSRSGVTAPLTTLRQPSSARETMLIRHAWMDAGASTNSPASRLI
ncbi:hypothetical protein F4802DRAFT_585110 [Xylaria palmicola]|nr:hypothetical protein F4802DRAFT_585110 [Xylaria palmicola]